MYRPILVELDDEEMDRYIELTLEIVEAWRQDRDDATKNALLRRRSELLNAAHGKLEVLKELFPRGGRATHTLVYTTPGQLDAVVSVLADHAEQRVHRFTYRETTDVRRRLLEGFDRGEFEILIAIRCLDEGVDVPSTRTAVLLASSGNPRQFVQRRGRILRPSPGKKLATIHDLIAVPAERDPEEDSWEIERGILRREVARFVEFAESATNTYEARAVLLPLQQRYQLLDL